MTDNVIQLVPDSVGEAYEVQVVDVLDGAAAEGLTMVGVIGYDADGGLFVAGSHGDGELIMLLERAKHYILFGEGG
jgi:hypothetical protein